MVQLKKRPFAHRALAYFVLARGTKHTRVEFVEPKSISKVTSLPAMIKTTVG